MNQLNNSPIYTKGLKTCIDELAEFWYSGDVVGQYNNYEVLTIRKSGRHYTSWYGNRLVSITSLENGGVVDDVFVMPEYRQTGMMTVLLDFYVTVLGNKALTIAKPHEEYMRNLMKYLHRFNKHWVNTLTNEKIEYGTQTEILDLANWNLVLTYNSIDNISFENVASDLQSI